MSWIIAGRLGLKTNLAPTEITAIRCAVAGAILLPYLIRKGVPLDRLGWSGLTAIIMGGGAPMVLAAFVGLQFAPASHAASLYTALIPLLVAILATFTLGEGFSAAKRSGLALIVFGAVIIVWGAGGRIGSAQNIGHVLFISAAFLWACYTVAMRKAGLDGLHAAAIAAVGSLLLYVPAFVVFSGGGVINAPWHDIAVQALVQGFLTPVVSYWLFGRAVAILGASRGSAFAALSPAITAIVAIPLLGEWPWVGEWIAIGLISGGVYVVSRDGLPIKARWMAPR